MIGAMFQLHKELEEAAEVCGEAQLKHRAGDGWIPVRRQRRKSEQASKESRSPTKSDSTFSDPCKLAEVQEPVRFTQPRCYTSFDDPKLEELSAGQKILVRMGGENAAKVKTKLREIRERRGVKGAERVNASSF
jgi:hypothetical protein